MSELEQLRNDLNSTIDALTKTAVRLKQSARLSVEKSADYEQLKSNYKIQLAAEDTASGAKARTVSLIESMYRLKFAHERLMANLAKIEHDTDVLLFKGLQAKLNALQTVARLSESEMRMGAHI